MNNQTGRYLSSQQLVRENGKEIRIKTFVDSTGHTEKIILPNKPLERVRKGFESYQKQKEKEQKDENSF